VRLQGSFYPKWRSAPSLSIDHREVSPQEPRHRSDWFCSRPRREVHRRPTNELGEVPHELVGTRLQGSTRSRIRVPLQLASNPDCFHHMGDAGRCDLLGHRAL
jgi:hypothetical protein